MGFFQKKDWKKRIVEFPGRRRLDDTSQPEVYDVSRAEGTIIQAGDGFTTENMNGIEERVGEAFNNVANVFSDAFSKDKAYVAGDYAIYEDSLYKFTASKAAGAWDGSKIQATTVSDALRELNGKIPTQYAGSASAGGSANSAVKLDSNAGSATQPVYFNAGKPVACTYSLGKSVPANAVFTDTWRGIQNNLTSTSTTDSLSAAQGKELNENKARIVKNTWGTSLKVVMPHGLLLKSTGYVCLIWAAGSPGNYDLNHSVIFGSEDMNLTINKTTGEVTATMKSGANAGITYIGL